MSAYTGELVLAQAVSDIPGSQIGGRLIVRVHPPGTPGGRKLVTIEQADPVVILSWRLLFELTRRDSVLPWMNLERSCSCPPGRVCWDFQQAKLIIETVDRPLIYILADGLPERADAVVARWPD